MEFFEEDFFGYKARKRSWLSNAAHNLDISLVSFVKKHLKVIEGEFVVMILNVKKNSLKE